MLDIGQRSGGTLIRMLRTDDIEPKTKMTSSKNASMCPKAGYGHCASTVSRSTDQRAYWSRPSLLCTTCCLSCACMPISKGKAPWLINRADTAAATRDNFWWPFGIAVTSQVVPAKPRIGTKKPLIRLWGRRRLSLLKRLLPHTDTVSVSLLGQGMPSYWTLTGKGFHFTFCYDRL